MTSFDRIQRGAWVAQHARAAWLSPVHLESYACDLNPSSTAWVALADETNFRLGLLEGTTAPHDDIRAVRTALLRMATRTEIAGADLERLAQHAAQLRYAEENLSPELFTSTLGMSSSKAHPLGVFLWEFRQLVADPEVDYERLQRRIGNSADLPHWNRALSLAQEADGFLAEAGELVPALRTQVLHRLYADHLEVQALRRLDLVGLGLRSERDGDTDTYRQLLVRTSPDWIRTPLAAHWDIDPYTELPEEKPC